MRTSQKNNPGRKPQKHSSSGRKNAFKGYMQEKLAIMVIVITLALFALIYVLYDIIQKNQDSYNQIVLSQQQYDSRVIPYRRGDVVDRNGTYLATTEKVYNLIIDPKQIMSDQADYLQATVRALASVFGYDEQELRTLITGNPEKAYVRYARQLSHDQKTAFETLQKETNEANNKSGSTERVKGIWFEDEYRRIYPNNSLACSVVGFATSDGGQGTGGIEQFYNEELIGTNGREYGYLNDDFRLERVIKPARHGNTVVSTIDVNIQNVVEKRIQEWEAETGSKRIGVIVMDPNNGEVLAMANDKMFDLNNPRSAADHYTDDQLLELGRREAVYAYRNANKDSEKPAITVDEAEEHFTREELLSLGTQAAWNQEWRNFCISDTYEPGSPSKIFTVAAAMEEGLVSSANSFYCDGYQEVGGWPIKCTAYLKGGHQNLTLSETLMQSCNDAMMQIAAITGVDRFCKYQQMFGFGSKTGIDLPGEADTSNLVYTEDTMKPTDLATNSFGQTYNCSMIQMAAAYCSVINGGSYYEPHVVKQVLNEQGSVVRKVEPKLVRETVSESTADFIRDSLFQTVEQGTGKAAAVEGYRVAGKTGTAEKLPRKRGNYLVSFCGFAPAEDPEVLVYVVIDEPAVEDQARSSYASAVFSKILGDILPYLNVFPEMDAEISQEISDQLPQEEGISDQSGAGQQEETEAPKVYETEEYVSPEIEADSGIPDSLAGGTEAYMETYSDSVRVSVEIEPETAGTAESGSGNQGQTGETRRQTEAAETTAARRTQAAETTAARRTQAAETTAARRTQAAETTAARQTQAAETTAARRTQVAETTAARQTQAAETAAARGTEAAEGGSNQSQAGPPTAETTVSGGAIVIPSQQQVSEAPGQLQENIPPQPVSPGGQDGGTVVIVPNPN